MTTTEEHIAAIRKALEAGPTPGEWKSVSEPDFSNGFVYTSVQPVIPDEEAVKHLAMMNGEYHVCRMNHTAAERRFSYHRRNAAYIAACNPVSMTAVLSELDRIKEENERMRAALYEIVGLDHHNMGPESKATKMARAALKGETQ